MPKLYMAFSPVSVAFSPMTNSNPSCNEKKKKRKGKGGIGLIWANFDLSSTLRPEFWANLGPSQTEFELICKQAETEGFQW